MRLKLKETLVAVGFIAGGIAQTGVLVNQESQIRGLRQVATEQALDIKDLKNDACWDFNLIQVLAFRALGVPPVDMVDCEAEAPRGHPYPIEGPKS